MRLLQLCFQVQPGVRLYSNTYAIEAHTHRQVHIYSIHLYICIYPVTLINSERNHSSHTNTIRAKSLILWLIRMKVCQWEIHIQVRAAWIPPAARMRHSVCPVAALDPSLSSCWHLDMGAPEATAPLQLLIETTSLTHTQNGSL